MHVNNNNYTDDNNDVASYFMDSIEHDLMNSKEDEFWIHIAIVSVWLLLNVI